MYTWSALGVPPPSFYSIDKPVLFIVNFFFASGCIAIIFQNNHAIIVKNAIVANAYSADAILPLSFALFSEAALCFLGYCSQGRVFSLKGHDIG